MKKVNKDPFDNGSDHRAFEYYCCGKCIKSSQPRDDFRYTNADKNMMPKCSIQRDIVTRMFCDDDIYSPARPILEFVEKNGLDKTFWVSFLHKIDERQYSELRNILSDNQTVEKYFLKN